jgi:hypothetical protein
MWLAGHARARNRQNNLESSCVSNPESKRQGYLGSKEEGNLQSYLGRNGPNSPESGGRSSGWSEVDGNPESNRGNCEASTSGDSGRDSPPDE